MVGTQRAGKGADFTPKSGDASVFKKPGGEIGLLSAIA